MLGSIIDFRRGMGPQIFKGTVDLKLYPPPQQEGVFALGENPSADPLPSTARGCGYAEAENESTGPTSELLAFFPWPGRGSPSDPADLRLPDFVGDQRAAHLFTDFDDFKDVVAARRAAMSEAISCFSSSGYRYGDLNTSFSEAGDLGVETRDLYVASQGGSPIGCTFIYRASASQTGQHWVMFNGQMFNDIRAVKRTSGGYGSLSSFLSAMAALRQQSQTAFAHSVETCTHYLDCPW